MGNKLAAKAKEVKEEPLPDDSVSVRIINNQVSVPPKSASPYISMGNRLASRAKEICIEDAKNSSRQLGTGATSEATPNPLMSSPIQEERDALPSPPAAETAAVVRDSELHQSERCTAEERGPSETTQTLREEETKTAAMQRNQKTKPKMASILSGLATANGQDGWIQHLKSLASAKEEPLLPLHSTSDSEGMVTNSQMDEEMSSEVLNRQQELPRSAEKTFDSESVLECSDSTDFGSNASLLADLENILCASSADQDVNAEQVSDSCPETDPSVTHVAHPPVQDSDFSGPEHFLASAISGYLSTNAGDVSESSPSDVAQSDEGNSPDWRENFAEGPVTVKDSSEQVIPDAKGAEAIPAIQSDEDQEIDCETRKARSERTLNPSRISNASHSHTASEDPWKSDQHKSQGSIEDAAPEGDYESTIAASSPKDSKDIVESANCHSYSVEEASPGGLSTTSGELETEACKSEDIREEVHSVLQDQVCKQDDHPGSKSSVNTGADSDWFSVKEFLPEKRDSNIAQRAEASLTEMVTDSHKTLAAEMHPEIPTEVCDTQADSAHVSHGNGPLDKEDIHFEFVDDGEYDVSEYSSTGSIPAQDMKLLSSFKDEPVSGSDLSESQDPCGEKEHPCLDLGHLDMNAKVSESNTELEVNDDDDVGPVSCETAEQELEGKTEPGETINTSTGVSMARKGSETALPGLTPAALELKETVADDDIPTSSDKAVNTGGHVSADDGLEDRESVDNWEKNLAQGQNNTSESEEGIAKESPSNLRKDLNLDAYQQNKESCTEQDEECNQIPVNNRVSDSSAEASHKNRMMQDDDIYPEEQTYQISDPHRDGRCTVGDPPVLVGESCSPSSSQDATTIKTPVKTKDKGVNTDEIRMCTRAISTKKIVTKNFGIATDLATTVNRAVDTPSELEEMYMKKFVEALQRVSILEITLQCERDLMASQKNNHSVESRELKDSLQEKHARLMDVERELEVRRKQLMSELKKKTLEHRELEGCYNMLKSKYVATEKQNSCLSRELECVTRQLLDLEKIRDKVISKSEAGTDTQELDKAQEYSDGITAERMVALMKRAKSAELEMLEMKRQSIEQKIKSALTDAEYTYNIYAESSQLSFPEKAHLVTKWTEYQNTMQTHTTKLESRYNSLVRLIRNEDRELDKLPELVAPELDAFTVTLPKRSTSNHPCGTAKLSNQPRSVFQFSSQPRPVFHFLAQPAVNTHAVPNTCSSVSSAVETMNDVHPDNQMPPDLPGSETLIQSARAPKAVGRGRGRRLSSSQCNLRRPGEQPTREADSMDQSCSSTEAAAAEAASGETEAQDEPSVTTRPLEMPETLPLPSHQTDLSKMPSDLEKEALPQGFRFGGPSGDGGGVPPGPAEEQHAPSVTQSEKQPNAPRSHSEHISNMQKRMRSASMLSRLRSTFTERPQHQTGMDGMHTLGHSARKLNMFAAPIFNKKAPTSHQSDELLSERSADAVETTCQPAPSCGTFAKSDTGEAPKEVTISSCDYQFANEELQESLTIPSSSSILAGVGASQTSASPVLKSAEKGRNPVDPGNPCEVLSEGDQSSLTPAQKISMDWRSQHTGNQLAGVSEGMQSCRLGSEAPVPSSSIQLQPSVLPTSSQASLSNKPEPPISTLQPLTPTPGPLLPTSEPSVPTTEPSVPSPEPSTPTTEPSVPTPEPSYPNPQQSYPNPQRSYPNPQRSYPNPQTSYPNPQQSYSSPQTSYPNPQTLYPNPQTSYPNSQQSYPSPQTSYPNPQTSYPNPQTSYPNPQTSYPNPQTSYPNPQTSYPNPQTSYLKPSPPLPTYESFVPTSAALLPTPGAFVPTPGALLPNPMPLLSAPEPPLPLLIPLLPAPQLVYSTVNSNTPASAVHNQEMRHDQSWHQPSTQWMKSDTDDTSFHDRRTPLYQRKQSDLPPRFQASRRVQQQRRPSQSEDHFTVAPDPINIEPKLSEVEGLKKRKTPALDQLDDTRGDQVAAAKEAPVEEEAEKDEWQTQISKRKKKALAHLEAEQRQQQQAKAGKKGCMDKLIGVLCEQFDVKHKDVIDVIRQVRMDHNGSLSGTPFSAIIAESRLYLQAKLEPPRPQPMNTPQLPKPRDRELPTLQAIQRAVPNQGTDMCVICQEDMNSKSGDVRMLDCGHLFHDECISIWYNTRERTCPICRCHTLFAEDFPRLQ
ncbi:titin homolog isoform X2 [Patiria miniata]|nr:titin homolog isoform X2 [Patiria miniata]